MMKRLVRTCVATGCRATGLLALAARRAHGSLTILCYHRVLPADKKAAYFLPDLVVTPEAFRRQCLTLRKHFDVLPLSEATESPSTDRSDARPLAAVTFDDGYQDNFRYAAPVLRETGVKATFFAIADLVGAKRPPWYDRLGRTLLTLGTQVGLTDLLSEFGIVDVRSRATVDQVNGTFARHVVGRAKALTPDQRSELVDRLCAATDMDASHSPDDLIMDWQQLTELADEGHEIGSHGRTHEILPQLDDASLEFEVVGSRQVLEQGLGRPVRSFCYPNGDVDERVARAVRAAGYSCAVTVEEGSNEPARDAYRLKRWFIHEDRLASLGGEASEALLRMELCGLSNRVFGHRRRRAIPQ